MTFEYGPLCTGATEGLLQSDADWISPGYDKGDYRGVEDGPEPNDGNKVILLDSDHIGGIYGDSVWVWKAFVRGLNVLYMDDPYNYGSLQFRTVTTAGRQFRIDDAVRVTMGDVLSYARKLPLAEMAPSKSICSTHFALVKTGEEIFCFAPHGGKFTVDLTAGAGRSFTGEIFDISTRRRSILDPAAKGGTIRQFACPVPNNPCVLHLRRSQQTQRAN